VFVRLFAVNAKTTAQIDAKRSGITKNDLESVLRRLKSPVLVLSVRYRDISVFPSQLTAIFTYLPSTFGSCLDSFLNTDRLHQNTIDGAAHRSGDPAKGGFTANVSIMCSDHLEQSYHNLSTKPTATGLTGPVRLLNSHSNTTVDWRRLGMSEE